MFAHGEDDLRSPVYDLTVLPPAAVEHINSGANVGFEKGPAENEQSYHLDPRWNERAFILKNYKTEPCPRYSNEASRICRLGTMCPYYHTYRDRRRKLSEIKYRATACPLVKVRDEWGDVAECDKADRCAYCHSRMELQFHPDVYKSIKCETVKKYGHCAKGIFCAFAHDDDGTANKDKSQDQVGITALGVATARTKIGSDSVDDLSEITIPPAKAERTAELSKSVLGNNASGNLRNSMEPDMTVSSAVAVSSTDMFASVPRTGRAEVTSSAGVLGLTNGDASGHNSAVTSLWSDMSALQVGSAGMMSFSGATMPLYAPVMMNTPLMMAADVNNPLESMRQHHILAQSASQFHPLTLVPHTPDNLYGSAPTSVQSFSGEMSQLMTDEGREIDSLDFDFQKDVQSSRRVSSDAASSSHSASPMLSGTSSSTQMKGLSETESDSAATLKYRQHSEQPAAAIQQPYLVRLRMDLDMANRRLEIAEEEKRQIVQQRDEAIEQLAKLKGDAAGGDKLDDGRYLRSLHPTSSLSELTVPLLQHIEKQLKSDLQLVRETVLMKSAGKCLNCLERSASLRLPICHHKVLCEVCYMNTNECPTCQAAITIPQ